VAPNNKACGGMDWLSVM